MTFYVFLSCCARFLEHCLKHYQVESQAATMKRTHGSHLSDKQLNKTIANDNKFISIKDDAVAENRVKKLKGKILLATFFAKYMCGNGQS